MLQRLEILQVYKPGDAEPAQRALRLAAMLAVDLGAGAFCHGEAPTALGHGFYDLPEKAVGDTPEAWQSAAPDGVCRLVLRINDDSALPGIALAMPAWECETTLFAGSGIAHLLGDPERAPLVPQAHFAAHTLGYTVFAALVGLAVAHRRFGRADTARLDGRSALAWVNWKAMVNAAYDEHICRQGKMAEWPVAKVTDGYVAFVYNLPDWPQVVDLIDHDELRTEKFDTWKGRMKHAATYLRLAREFFADKTKDAMREAFLARAIPSFPVTDIDDLQRDPLLVHRGTFTERNGTPIVRPPYRTQGQAEGAPVAETMPADSLPLAGMRVLDLGMITAGAGVSAMLADLGAEVLKIETEARPDPFRIWPTAGKDSDDTDAPVFKSNNRNKYGLSLDLKTEQGLQDFYALVEGADIVLENFRRGVIERLGLDFTTLSKINPRLVLASISSQGADGPGSDHATFGSTLEASSGFAAVTRYDDGVPVISGRNLNYPDQIVCLVGGGVIAAAAAEARATGTGRHVDVSQRDCAIYQMGDVIAAGRPQAETDFAAMVQSDDGTWHGLALPDADAMTELTGGKDAAAWAAGRSAEAIADAAEALGGGLRQVATGQKLLDDEDLWARQIWMRSPDGALVKGFPFQTDKVPLRIYADSPKLGADTGTILAELEKAG